MCAGCAVAIFQIYIVGPLTGSVMATLVCYMMWCGCSRSAGQPRLPSFNSLRPPSCTTKLRLGARVVQYFAASCRPVDDGQRSPAVGGPPLCYFCAESTPASTNRRSTWPPRLRFVILMTDIWRVKRCIIIIIIIINSDKALAWSASGVSCTTLDLHLCVL